MKLKLSILTLFLALAPPILQAQQKTISGTWKQKIGKQYWLAMYNRGIMGWYVYRKFDAPILNIATGSELPVPKRYTYPVVEQTRNEDNYITASAAIGGDKLSTPIFWDIN